MPDYTLLITDTATVTDAQSLVALVVRLLHERLGVSIEHETEGSRLTHETDTLTLTGDE